MIFEPNRKSDCKELKLITSADTGQNTVNYQQYLEEWI